MITKENGLRYAKLIHVSVDNGKTDNSNKVYVMEELSDGRIKCEYGRVGKAMTTEYKPSSKWSSVYNQKTGKSKGYTDVTELSMSLRSLLDATFYVPIPSGSYGASVEYTNYGFYPSNPIDVSASIIDVL